MATVRNTIALNDKMTPVLRSITKALDSTLIALASTDKVSNKAFEGVKRDIRNARNAVEGLNLEVQELQQPVDNARKGFSAWQSAIVTANQGIQLIQQGIQGINKVTGFFDGLMGISSRLNLITEDQLSLQEKIYAAAQRSRGEYTAMASTVAKLNLLAANAFAPFGGEDATVKFAETLNKAFVISGAGTTERQSAMYQMAQALSSGRLQGDEYRSIIENAPLVAKSIEKYMREVKGLEGTMKDWASEGLLTSDVIIAAVQNASTEIDEQFAGMPKKFGDHMTELKNKALWALAPITARFETLMQSQKFNAMMEKASQTIVAGINWLDKMFDKLEAIGNNPGFQQFAQTAGRALALVATVLGWIFGLALDIFNLVMAAWPVLEPVLFGVAAALLLIKAPLLAQAGLWLWNTILVPAYTAVLGFLQHGYMVLTNSTYRASAAQLMYNSVMLASPVTWIIMALIALIAVIFAVVNAVNAATGSTTSAFGIIVGALAVAAAAIWNTVLMLIEFVLAGINGVWNYVGMFVNFFANVFKDPIGSVIHLFGGFADTVLGLIESVAKGIDNLIGTNLAQGVSKWRSGLEGNINKWASEYGNGSYQEVMSSSNLTVESLGLGRWEYGDAWDSGYNWGAKAEADISASLDSLGLNDLTKTAEDLATGQQLGNGTLENILGSDGVKGEVSITDEDIKLLKDVAQAEWVNKYTTLRPEMTVTFGDVHETADANQLLEVMETMIENAYASALTEG